MKPTLLFVAVQKFPDYLNISCLLVMSILMLPTTMQDSDLIYKFIVKQYNNCLSGKGNGQILSGAKVLGQGFHSTFLVIALSLSDIWSYKSSLHFINHRLSCNTKGDSHNCDSTEGQNYLFICPVSTSSFPVMLIRAVATRLLLGDKIMVT